MRFKLPKQNIRSSVLQEKRIARDTGGRRVAGSGSQPGNKSDVTAGKWRVEAKQTTSSRYSLTLAVWRKIEMEAFRAGQEPVLVVEISGRKLAVLDYQMWLGLREGLP